LTEISADPERENMQRTPLHMIEALSVSSLIDAEALAARRRGFASVHMGTQELTLGALMTLLREEPSWKPPRTAHIGNWEDIAQGRAGAMDFNKTICAWGLGYPLICSFTQTEAEGASGGDSVYLPGSLVGGGRREVLSLFTWDGSRFARRDRQNSFFCPFVMADVDGELTPLNELHWGRMQSLPGFRFTLEAALMLEHGAEMREMLTILLEVAETGDDGQIRFQDLISQSVARDGTVSKRPLQRRGRGYVLSDCFFPTTESLVEHVMLTLEAAAKPRQFFARISELPCRLPLISNVLTRILCAIFTAQRPDSAARTGRAAGPLNLHLHWGARDMAGFPPRRMGYFVSPSKTERMGNVCKALIDHFDEIAPVCFALLPVAVFMLCPTSAHPRDAELLTELFAETLDASGGDATHSPDEALSKVEAVTLDWKARHAAALSPYFLSRFAPRAGVMHPCELPRESEPIEPEGFRDLSLRRACMIVGALTESVAASRL
jgi:hypothetical protein